MSKLISTTLLLTLAAAHAPSWAQTQPAKPAASAPAAAASAAKPAAKPAAAKPAASAPKKEKKGGC